MEAGAGGNGLNEALECLIEGLRGQNQAPKGITRPPMGIKTGLKGLNEALTYLNEALKGLNEVLRDKTLKGFSNASIASIRPSMPR